MRYRIFVSCHEMDRGVVEAANREAVHRLAQDMADLDQVRSGAKQARYQAFPEYIPMHLLEDGWLYAGHGRNLHMGVWDAREGGFHYVRRKFDDLFMDIEYHWDNGLGTFRPYRRLEEFGDMDRRNREGALFDWLEARRGKFKDLSGEEWEEECNSYINL